MPFQFLIFIGLAGAIVIGGIVAAVGQPTDDTPTPPPQDSLAATAEQPLVPNDNPSDIQNAAAPEVAGDIDAPPGLPGRQTGTATAPLTAATPSATTASNPPATPRPPAGPTLSLAAPDQVASGQSFTIRWRIDGPSDQQGSNTTLTVERHTSESSSGSSSTSNNTSSQSLGSFTVPASFDANFTFSGTAGPINVTVTAKIGTETLTKHHTIQLIP